MKKMMENVLKYKKKKKNKKKVYEVEVEEEEGGSETREKRRGKRWLIVKYVKNGEGGGKANRKSGRKWKVG